PQSRSVPPSVSARPRAPPNAGANMTSYLRSRSNPPTIDSATGNCDPSVTSARRLPVAKRKKAEAQEASLPKRLAGVKIPKELRRQAHHLAELARHPLVKEIVAAGLVALAATVREGKRDGAARVKKKVADAAEAAASAATEAMGTDSKAAPKKT